jgi:hypothetical protein
MSAVIFDPAAFKARYPEFTSVSNTLVGEYFKEAGLYLSNTDNSPVSNLVRRSILLNMLTAHVAYLGGALSADGMPRPVGRISQAAEGSVSASFEDTPPTPGSGPWFRQTQYGAAFWQATSNLRGMRYIPCPTRY